MSAKFSLALRKKGAISPDLSPPWPPQYRRESEPLQTLQVRCLPRRSKGRILHCPSGRVNIKDSIQSWIYLTVTSPSLRNHNAKEPLVDHTVKLGPRRNGETPQRDSRGVLQAKKAGFGHRHCWSIPRRAQYQRDVGTPIYALHERFRAETHG